MSQVHWKVTSHRYIGKSHHRGTWACHVTQVHGHVTSHRYIGKSYHTGTLESHITQVHGQVTSYRYMGMSRHTGTWTCDMVAVTYPVWACVYCPHHLRHHCVSSHQTSPAKCVSSTLCLPSALACVALYTPDENK